MATAAACKRNKIRKKQNHHHHQQQQQQQHIILSIPRTLPTRDPPSNYTTEVAKSIINNFNHFFFTTSFF
jgi:hypothetical protein